MGDHTATGAARAGKELVLILGGARSGKSGFAERLARVVAELDQLWAVFAAGGATWLVVSNEVGLGLVPPYPLGRRYRDLLGLVNRRVAARADRVYLLVAGLPLALKAPDR